MTSIIRDNRRSQQSTSCSKALTNRDALIVDRITWLSSRFWKTSSKSLKQTGRQHSTQLNMMTYFQFYNLQKWTWNDIICSVKLNTVSEINHYTRNLTFMQPRPWYVTKTKVSLVGFVWSNNFEPWLLVHISVSLQKRTLRACLLTSACNGLRLCKVLCRGMFPPKFWWWSQDP